MPIAKSIANTYLWTDLSKRMEQKPELTDYLEAIKTIEIQIKEHKLNIKDARRALRHSPTRDERKMYHRVIDWNKQNLRDAKLKRRLIVAQTRSTWWMWLIAAILCVIILVTVPGAPVALVFAPLWILILFGFIYILFAVKK